MTEEERIQKAIDSLLNDLDRIIREEQNTINMFECTDEFEGFYNGLQWVRDQLHTYRKE